MLLEPLRVALEALWANKLRAVLTMLGVIIGVASVIVMIAVVQGARHRAIEQIISNGSNVILGAYNPRSDKVKSGAITGFEMNDITAIAKECSLVAGVSPVASSSVDVQFKDKSIHRQ